MKSKITKIQKILMKGIAVLATGMMLASPMAYATTSLDDAYLESSWWEQVLYGKIGSTAREIEEYLVDHTTLYITNETQLRALAEYVNNGNDCSGKQIILLNDIEVDKNNEWVPIGNIENPFEGNFNGNNFTISGLRFSRENKTYEEMSYVGLFGKIKNAIIKNLTSENFNINILYEDAEISDNKDEKIYFSAGNIAGEAYGGIIENCINKSSIKGAYNVGGIVGTAYDDTTIKNCSNIGKVEGYGKIGGILGASGEKTIVDNVKIVNCINKGKVKGNEAIGGIIGVLQSKTGKINNCLNKGEIIGKERLGGIVGNSGNTEGSDDLLINNSTNEGIVSGTNYVGGIIGVLLSKTGKINNCLNKGEIIGEERIGGIVGVSGSPLRNDNLSILNCVNEGKVSGNLAIAGIIGNILTETSSINNCFSNGEVIGDIAVGGIIGSAGSLEDDDNLLLENSTNEGKVSGTSAVGGLIGSLASEIYNVNNCINKGEITGERAVGGIVGASKDASFIRNSSNVGIVNGVQSTENAPEGIGFNKDGLQIGATIEDNVISAKFNPANVTYTIYKNGQEVTGSEYFKAGDIIKVIANFDKYLAKTYGPLVAITEAPTLKINDSIEMTAGNINASTDNYTTTIDYTYTVQDGDNINITSLNLSKSGRIYAISGDDYLTNHPEITTSSVTVAVSGMEIDTEKPTINTKVYVENMLETERYTAGKEILFAVTTSETIQGLYEVPEIQVSFSESGIGKYNYNKETNKVGFVKCIGAKINLDGTTTWTYSYQIQEFDEGYVNIEYKAGIITDLAGNETILVDTYKAEKADKTNLKNDGINITKVEVLKNDKTTLVTANEYISENIYVRVYVDSINLYSDINTKMTTKTAPDLYLNGTIKQSDITNIDFTNGYIEYEYNTKNLVKLVEISMVSLINKVDLYEENQSISNAIPVGAQTDFEIEKFYLDGINFITKESTIYADTTAPTVDIIPVDVNNGITNNDTITYAFKFSEEVKDFKDEDITVNNGIKGTLSDAIKDEEGKYIYTIDIIPNVSDGNVNNLQVLVEQNACQDLVGHGNVRTESIITVDKKAPILLSLEAYAASNIALNKDIDIVKENYRIGEEITIVATFDENIVLLEENVTGLPELSLQFSESGNAKGTVSGIPEGNKIIYTYKIVSEDEGTLSVKGFTGTVVDAAGNETRVTKRALDGDTIIADTKAPTLKELNVTTSEGTYKANNTINIEAIYSEDIYALENNEIKDIVSNTAPTLKFKFGNGEEREAVAVGYGTKEDGTKDKSKVIYTCTVVDGDNGILTITSYKNKENVKACDIAGNEAVLVKNQTGNEVIADTIRPQVTNITASVENPSITNTGIYHKEGNTVKITLTFDEKVSGAVLWPKIQVGFSEMEGQEPEAYNDYAYESDWNVNSQTIEYSYTIKAGDNGYLWVKVPEGQVKDSAWNTNVAEEATQVSTIYADTVRPFYGDQPGIEYVDNKYKVTFNENLYYLNESNVVTSFGDTKQAPLLKFEGQETVYEPSISGNFITYAGEYINAKPYLGASRLCDKAGNLYAYYDQEAPKLLKIEVTSPETGTYKAGQETTIVAEFNEKVIGTAPTLMIVFGDGETREIDVGNIKDNTIEYKYIIQNGDNGSLAIIDYDGTGLTDLDNNKWVKPENLPTLTGKIITADTKAPTLTITSDVERTNKEVVTYTFIWSEMVTGFTAEDIEVTNGSKGAFKATDEDENGYATEYTLEVDTTNEGRQIVKVNSGICEDIAGNLNVERATYNNVVIDYTKPVIRAKVNGGNYVLDNTDPGNKKSTLKETIVVDEELSSMQYVWSSSETIPEDGWVSEDVSTILVNSDINLTKEVKETGTYYLYIKATDKAGNTLEAKTKAFVVKTSKITLTPDKTEITNQDVTVTVKYGEGLTENRKAGVSGLTQSADASKVIITENGTVYAEATDKAGNKVCEIREIENIDKIAPEGTITYVTNKDKSVTATISFNEKNVTITNNNGESTYVFEENGEFTFEFKDAVGNKSTAVAKVTTIEKSEKPAEEDKTAPTIIFEDLPTIQVNGVKYVKVSADMTAENITNKMDKDALCEATPEYTKLTSDNKLKTGSEITINDETKYVIVVNGDVNGDGKVTFLEDVIMANNYRIGQIKLSTVQMLAADVNNSGEIEFIPDIVAINNYRLGIIKSL